MTRNSTASPAPHDQARDQEQNQAHDQRPNQPHDRALVTAEEWFGGGRRISYDPRSARVLTEQEAAVTPGALHVFERAPAEPQDADVTWLTMLPGFPDGSYGWAQVDRLLGDELGPRLYVEPVGQGDSDKPRDYPYSSVERADLIQALWRYHGVRRTVVVTFDYTSLALLELLRRQLEQPGGTTITAVFMVNGGLFADANKHPWQGTPLLRSPLGALAMRGWQRRPAAFEAGWKRARARELDGTVALYVGGSEEDAYEHRQIPATRQRVPQAEILTFPGGHLTTSEHPDLLAAAIRRIAERHGVGTR